MMSVQSLRVHAIDCTKVAYALAVGFNICRGGGGGVGGVTTILVVRMLLPKISLVHSLIAIETVAKFRTASSTRRVRTKELCTMRHCWIDYKVCRLKIMFQRHIPGTTWNSNRNPIMLLTGIDGPCCIALKKIMLRRSSCRLLSLLLLLLKRHELCRYWINLLLLLLLLRQDQMCPQRINCRNASASSSCMLVERRRRRRRRL
mmetsp:Transcript_1424/g.2079  ORF Transcript_1424/g.2079 Transcript_1424/m.2079 type:complete len:203 (+) Transcript_1424:1150-1758(+)